MHSCSVGEGLVRDRAEEVRDLSSVGEYGLVSLVATDDAQAAAKGLAAGMGHHCQSAGTWKALYS